jgi:hypothetical protein
LIPDARGTKCHQEFEPIIDTKHSHILRVPFYTEKGILRQWVSRFDIYPYLERFTQVCIHASRFFTLYCGLKLQKRSQLWLRCKLVYCGKCRKMQPQFRFRTMLCTFYSLMNFPSYKYFVGINRMQQSKFWT